MNAHLRRLPLRPALLAAQGGLGATLAAWPEAVVTVVCGDGARPANWLVRLLGARMAVQALVTSAVPTTDVLRAGAAVDGLHALSMLGVAWQAPDYRRSALASAGIAALFGASTGALAR